LKAISQVFVFTNERSSFEASLHGPNQVGALDGLGEKVVCSTSHGFDCAFDGAEGSHQNHVHGQVEVSDGAEQVNPGLPGHDEVGQYDVERLLPEFVQGVVYLMDDDGVEALARQQSGQRGGMFVLVIHDKNARTLLKYGTHDG
jgi:hypothetical protein